METQIKFRGSNSLTGLRSLIVEHLSELERAIHITGAQVVLTQQSATTSPCRAAVLLIMPGPDIHASADDQTLLAAWLKVHSDIQHQIHARKAQQVVRHKRNTEVRSSPTRRTGKPARR